MATQRKRKATAAKTRKPATRKPKYERVILFPTEPTTISPARMEAAVKAVIAERKGGKASF